MSQSLSPHPDWHVLVQQHLAASAHPLIVVLGPTASGKTAFSINLCRHIGSAEVINADSRQLYRRLTIGTAKVTPEEMQGVPHHLIDMLDPTQPVNIGWYREQAMRVMDDCHARSVVPVLVGGSMLYISAVIDGLQPLPAVDPALRERLEREISEPGGEAALYARLQQIDPEAAQSIDLRNHVYLIRALELAETTGEPLSKIKRTEPCPYDLLILGMDWPREELIARINARTAQMFAAGWVEEVAALLADGIAPDAPAMISQGYREIAAALHAAGYQVSGIRYQAIDAVRNNQQLREDIAAKTRQYAKRQMTWWRHDERIHWIHP